MRLLATGAQHWPLMHPRVYEQRNNNNNNRRRQFSFANTFLFTFCVTVKHICINYMQHITILVSKINAERSERKNREIIIPKSAEKGDIVLSDVTDENYIKLQKPYLHLVMACQR